VIEPGEVQTTKAVAGLSSLTLQSLEIQTKMLTRMDEQEQRARDREGREQAREIREWIGFGLVIIAAVGRDQIIDVVSQVVALL
jgi:hypothetical protein